MYITNSLPLLVWIWDSFHLTLHLAFVPSPLWHLSPPTHHPQVFQLPWLVSFLIYLDLEGYHCSPDMNLSLGNYPRNEQPRGPLVWSQPHLGLLWTRRGQPSCLREEGTGGGTLIQPSHLKRYNPLLLQYPLGSMLWRQTSRPKSQLHQRGGQVSSGSVFSPEKWK